MKAIGIIVLFLVFSNAFAQEDNVLATNPATAKWCQIKTPGFKLLYQRGFEKQAQRMANTLETIREPEGKGMKVVPKRIPILLQSQSAISNGFVTLAPRRSEFYTMPPQNYNFIGGGEWLSQLSVHEYRHIAQFQRSITGFNKLLYNTFGQEASAALAFITAPQWFWEGDAVATETAFTQYGRGRLPNFDLAFRSNLVEGRSFSYNKQYLRSYKNFVPNHYVLGYHMVSHMRKATNNRDIWGNIAGRAWRAPIPFAFSQAMKKEAGKNVVTFYNNMLQTRKQEFEAELKQLDFTPFENVTHRSNNTYTDYLYPQVLTDGRLVALKTGIGDIEQIIVFEEGKPVSKKFVVGLMNESGMLSAAGSKVVWNEYRFDPRWPLKNFSVVKGFDFNDKLQQQVSEKSRYAGAALSPDGDKVVTVQTDTSYRTNLVVLDYYTGKVLKAFPKVDGIFYSMARWADGGKSIVALKMIGANKGVVLIDYYSGAETVLIQPSVENIGHPVIAKGYLLYNSPYSGIDNVYALDMATMKRYQVTSVRYGAYNPSLSNDGKTLYFNNQSADGMDVVKMPFNPSAWKPLEQVPVPSNNTYQHLVEQEGHPHLLDSIPSTLYPSKRYRKIPHTLNPHSLGVYLENDMTDVDFGVSSKDILSTTQIRAGYVHDLDERSGKWQAKVSMQAMYPILDFTASYGKRNVNLGSITYNKVDGSDTIFNVRGPLNFAWTESNIEGGLRIPLNLTSSKFYTQFSLSNYVGLTQVTNFKNNIDGEGRIVDHNFPGFYPYFFRNYQDNGKLRYNAFFVNGYSLMKRAQRDINSKWGYAFYLEARNTPYGGDFRASQFAFLNYLYVPGFFKHHSLWGYWCYEKDLIRYQSQNFFSQNYLFRNQIPLPRGLTPSKFEKMYSMSVNYALPLFYPDWEVGPLLYIKRFRLNVFADYAFGDSPGLRQINPDATTTQHYASVGGELKFDINVFRFLPELNMGVRYSYGLQPSTTLVEFIMGTFKF